jgi:UDP-glucose 4-epimerase
LCRHLLHQGARVVVIDDFSSGRRENVDALLQDPLHRRALTVIEADVRDALDDLVGEPFDEIYHLAAKVGVRLVLSNPIAAAETNFDCTTRVLRFAVEAARNHGKAPATLLASSSEVYGQPDKLPSAEDDGGRYGPTTARRWSYALCKALNEHMGMAYHEEHGLPVVIARFFNTVGPGQMGTYGMVLPRFVSAALWGHPLEVHGDGRQIRCFCDVRDATPAVVELLRRPECAGGIYNVGSDRTISIIDLARLVTRLTGSSSEIRLVPYESVYGAGFEDARERKPDLGRLRRAIGFRERWSLEDTIRDLAAWIREEAVSEDARARIGSRVATPGANGTHVEPPAVIEPRTAGAGAAQAALRFSAVRRSFRLASARPRS